MHSIITREDAQDRELTYYYTGEPCSKGHVDYLYVTNKRCVQCTRDRDSKRSRSVFNTIKTSNVRQRAAAIEHQRELAQIEQDYRL